MEAEVSQPEAFGKRLKTRRAELGLTLNAVAEASGLNLFGIAKLEAGTRNDPAWSTVVALCVALGVTPDYFFDPPATRPTGKRK